jgi:hypothetical protein
MADPDGYTTIRTSEDVRDKARVTKAKLCMTWDEFVERAAETLDPCHAELCLRDMDQVFPRHAQR